MVLHVKVSDRALVLVIFIIIVIAILSWVVSYIYSRSISWWFVVPPLLFIVGISMLYVVSGKTVPSRRRIR